MSNGQEGLSALPDDLMGSLEGQVATTALSIFYETGEWPTADDLARVYRTRLTGLDSMELSGLATTGLERAHVYSYGDSND